MNNKYILKPNGEPVVELDLMTWARWFEESRAQRIVRQEHVGPSKISTVFLSLDHSFDLHGAPVLWETMVFGGPLDQETDRCSGNREQAEAMHQRMVAKVKAQVTP